MLDQDAEEAFDGAHERPMNHDRLMRLAVFAGVRQLEPLRIVEVDLDRRALPGAAEDVFNFDIDLWAIEDPFAGIHFVGHTAALERSFQRIGGDGPVFFGADGFLRAGRKIHFKLCKAEGAEDENVKSSTRLTSASI